MQYAKSSVSVLCLLVFSCAHDRAPAARGQEEVAQDSIRIPSGSPHLDFIKIESVSETDASGAAVLTGRVAFDEDHTQRVSSPIDGRVAALFVESGDGVKSGQRLLELSSPEVGRLQSEAQKAFQDATVATRTLDRLKRLRVDGAVSEKDLVQGDADYAKARSDAARAEAQLKALGISPSDPTVNASLRAHVSGTIVARNVLVGQEVRADAAEPLLTITNLDTVWVLADVYEQDLGLVEPGQSVRLHVPAYPDETFPGRVGTVGDVVDPQTRTVKMRCVVANPAHRLKPEMFVKVEVLNATAKKVVMIPSTAVLSQGETTKAIVAMENNVFRERVIEVGPERDGKVRLLGGLRPGERIVTDGALFLENELRD